MDLPPIADVAAPAMGYGKPISGIEPSPLARCVLDVEYLDTGESCRVPKSDGLSHGQKLSHGRASPEAFPADLARGRCGANAALVGRCGVAIRRGDVAALCDSRLAMLVVR